MIIHKHIKDMAINAAINGAIILTAVVITFAVLATLFFAIFANA